MKVFCILGDERVYRSKSPVMFSTVLRRQGMKGAYVPFMVKPAEIGKAVHSLGVLNIAGANVTIPYKESVIPHLDVLSEGANIIGAINTIVIRDNVLKGYNTNAIGIMDTLGDAGFEVEGKTALVFGTGGAAKAAVFILNWLRTAMVHVTGRNPEKTRAMADRFGGRAVPLEELTAAPSPAHVVVNATSVSEEKESPEMAALVRQLRLPECELVIDLNYGRSRGFWRETAEARNVRFIDGLTPLAFQARRTFALWTGLQAPAAEFAKAMESGDNDDKCL